MALEQLTPKQVKIVRQLRALILDILEQAGKTVGKTMLISDIYAALGQHFSVPVDKLMHLGNELIWSALYLLELQGWIRLETPYARVLVLRQKQSSTLSTNSSDHPSEETDIKFETPQISDYPSRHDWHKNDKNALVNHFVNPE